MAWTIELSEEAEAALYKLDKPIRQRLGGFIDRMASLPNPPMRRETLQGPLAGLWRYRVGDYRLVCHLRDETLVVLVVWLGHRREVYR